MIDIFHEAETQEDVSRNLFESEIHPFSLVNLRKRNPGATSCISKSQVETTSLAKGKAKEDSKVRSVFILPNSFYGSAFCFFARLDFFSSHLQ